jgi:cytochrome c peroxidase
MRLFIVTVAISCALFSCSGSGETTPEPDAGPDPNDGFTDAEITEMKKLSPLPAVPSDPTNQYADDAAAAALGQMLFFDRSYSGALTVGDDGSNGGLGAAGDTGRVSCQSCHEGGALDDQRSTPNNVSLGTDYGTRNALGIVNSAFYKWTNWGGRFDSQWSLPLAVAENAKIMKSTRLQVVHMLWDKYRTEYDAIFPVPLDPALDPAAPDASRFPPAGKPKAAAADPDGPWEAMAPGDRDIVNAIYVNYGKAIQAYQRLLVSRDAPFDRYVAGDNAAMADPAKRGLKLFLGKAGCVSCHSGPHFADDDFHALGVLQTGPNVPAADLGRYTDVAPLLASAFNTDGNFSDDTATGKLAGLAQTDSQRGQFRTKSLRGVALSGPYMHSGQHATLEEVIAFYNDGGGDAGDAGAMKDPLMKPLDLTAAEQADLIEFMKTLTGDAIPAALVTDTSK